MERDRLHVLIVDEEQDARHVLIGLFKGISVIGVVEESESIDEALFKIMDGSPDIIFLDTKTSGQKGMELMELLKKSEFSGHLVIVSEDRDLAIPAIKNNVYDFLLKPVRKDHLKKIVDKFMKKRDNRFDKKLNWFLKEVNTGKVMITTTYNHILIDPGDIVYCEADGAYTTIYLENGHREVANSYLGILEKGLSGQRFYRISRSYLINLEKLLKINKGDNTCVLLIGKKKVKLQGSKKQLKNLCEMDLI